MMEASCGIITTATLLLLITLICGTRADVRIVEPFDKSVTLTEGSDAVFKCRHPSTESVEWFLSGLRIVGSDLDQRRFQVSRSDEGQSSSVSTLIVRGLTPSDRGLYKCSNADTMKALDEQDTETDSVDVKVIAQLNVALAIDGPENDRVVAGHALWLTCRGHGSSDFVWYFNGDELRAGVNVAIVEKRDDQTGDKDSVLTVTEVTTDRQGKYRCRDRSSGSEASIDIQVTETADARNVKIIEPFDKSVTLTEGSDAVFKCRHPSTESVEWSLNGLRIVGSDLDQRRFQVSRSDEGQSSSSVSTLTVSAVTPSDRGLYKCSNADTMKAMLYQDTETDSVEVKIVKRLKIGIAIEGPENGRVVAGRDLWLTCRGHSSSDIVWYFNTDELRAGADVMIEVKRDDQTGVKDSVLTVAGVESNRQGRYRCYDRANGGEASMYIQVTGTGGRVGAATSKGFRFQSTVTLLLPIIAFAVIEKTV